MISRWRYFIWLTWRRIVHRPVLSILLMLVVIYFGGTLVIMDYDNIDDLEEGKKVLKLHERVANLEMVNHEFIDGNIRRQRSEFADGTKIEVDLDKNTYNIIYPDA